MHTVTLFYQYSLIKEPNALAAAQRKLCTKLGLKGRIIIACEGINGTLGGTRAAITAYQQEMLKHPLFAAIDFKDNPGHPDYFPRLSIKVKEEIVKMGISPEKLSAEDAGVHLSPQEAHALLDSNPEDLIILDGRNNYESRIGTFRKAVTPDIDNFRDFPAYIDNHTEQFKDKRVLMFCTGGIRCERASAYVKSKGVAKEVYQITGGIVRYVEQFPDGHFRGKNYVFDARVAVKVNDDILGSCDSCGIPYDEYTNCVNAFCNKQILSCPDCLKQLKNTCSERCAQLVQSQQVVIRTIDRKVPTPHE